MYEWQWEQEEKDQADAISTEAFEIAERAENALKTAEQDLILKLRIFIHEAHQFGLEMMEKSIPF